MSRRSLAVLLLLFALLSSVAPVAEGKDVYKCCLDPALPNHRAILDTLEKLKERPKDAGLHNDLGCLVARDGFWRDALREFSEAATLDPKDGRPHFNAGLVHAWKGEWSRARSRFRKATERDPGNWEAWWMTGYAEERLGNVRDALDAYKTSVRVDTSLFDVRRNPFAAGTRLKARVLLETYEKRLVQAALPKSEQLAEPDRVASFFQRSAPPPAPTPVPAVTVDDARTGPVVTTAAPASPGTPGGVSRSSPPGRPMPVVTPVISRPAPVQRPDGAQVDPFPDTGGAPPRAAEKGAPADEAAGERGEKSEPEPPGPGFGGSPPPERTRAPVKR